ncbi:hypothetical protein QFZ97_007253 [Paraburkholderia youngii]
MARTGLTRMDVKRAREALLAQGQHTSIDAIRIARQHGLENHDPPVPEGTGGR